MKFYNLDDQRFETDFRLVEITGFLLLQMQTTISLSVISEGGKNAIPSFSYSL